MRRPSRRTTFLVAAGLVAVLVVLNIAGILRSPIGPITGDPGYIRLGFSSDAHVETATAMFMGIEPTNHWPVSATIEGVRLVNPSDGLHLVEARLVGPNSPLGEGFLGLMYGPTGDTDPLYAYYDGLPSTLAAQASTIDSRMWLAVESYKPGERSFDDVLIDYRVGPFSFTTNMRRGFVVCVIPMPSGAACSWDDQ